MDVIEIINLTKDYGNNKGIFDVSFSIKQGECVGFLGSNGAGKTQQSDTLWDLFNLNAVLQKYWAWTVLKSRLPFRRKSVICREKLHLWTI